MKTAMTKSCLTASLPILVALSISACAAPGFITPGDAILNIPRPTGPISPLPDGSYEGTYTVAVPTGIPVMFRAISAKVEYANGELRSVTVEKPMALSSDARFVAMGAAIVAQGALNVDLVSGASFSSVAFLKAVELAVTR